MRRQSPTKRKTHRTYHDTDVSGPELSRTVVRPITPGGRLISPPRGSFTFGINLSTRTDTGGIGILTFAKALLINGWMWTSYCTGTMASARETRSGIGRIGETCGRLSGYPAQKA
jgi:hypothetical protein